MVTIELILNQQFASVQNSLLQQLICIISQQFRFKLRAKGIIKFPHDGQDVPKLSK